MQRLSGLALTVLVSLDSFIEFKFSVCFPTVLELYNIKNKLQWFLFFWLDSYTDIGEKRCEPASEDKFLGSLMEWSITSSPGWGEELFIHHIQMTIIKKLWSRPNWKLPPTKLSKLLTISYILRGFRCK